MNRFLAAVLAALCAALPALATAQAPAAVQAASALPNTGEVRRVNREARKITIAHGPLKEVNMPPMTMAFGVADPALLDKVKTGDKVRFALRAAGDDMTLTAIEVSR